MGSIKKQNFCRKSGCCNLATFGGYCKEHQDFVEKRVHEAHVDEYDRTWRKIRNAYFAQNPLCEDCLKAGETVPGREVHHIVPLEFGGTKADWDNLVTLCSHCHRKRHATLYSEMFLQNQINNLKEKK